MVFHGSLAIARPDGRAARCDQRPPSERTGPEVRASSPRVPLLCPARAARAAGVREQVCVCVRVCSRVCACVCCGESGDSRSARAARLPAAPRPHLPSALGCLLPPPSSLLLPLLLPPPQSPRLFFFFSFLSRTLSFLLLPGLPLSRTRTHSHTHPAGCGGHIPPHGAGIKEADRAQREGSTRRGQPAQPAPGDLSAPRRPLANFLPGRTAPTRRAPRAEPGWSRGRPRPAVGRPRGALPTGWRRTRQPGVGRRRGPPGPLAAGMRGPPGWWAGRGSLWPPGTGPWGPRRAWPALGASGRVSDLRPGARPTPPSSESPSGGPRRPTAVSAAVARASRPRSARALPALPARRPRSRARPASRSAGGRGRSREAPS